MENIKFGRSLSYNFSSIFFCGTSHQRTSADEVLHLKESEKGFDIRKKLEMKLFFAKNLRIRRSFPQLIFFNTWRDAEAVAFCAASAEM